jgi:hypothetical protein
MLGKAAFYFGFIFFSLDLVSFTLKPLALNPVFTEVLSRSSTPLMATIAGMLITAIVQSSSITTGLCILLVQQNLMPANGSDSDRDWVKHWDDGDCSGRQPQDEKDGTTRGRGEPLLQYLWRPAVPAVSRTVRGNRGGPGG